MSSQRTCSYLNFLLIATHKQAICITLCLIATEVYSLLVVQSCTCIMITRWFDRLTYVQSCTCTCTYTQEHIKQKYKDMYVRYSVHYCCNSFFIGLIGIISSQAPWINHHVNDVMLSVIPIKPILGRIRFEFLAAA